MSTLIPILIVGALASLVAAAAAGIGAALISPSAATVTADGGPVDLAPERRTLLGRAAIAGLVVGLVLLVIALLARAFVVGHAPWSNLHEFSLAFAAALLATYLLLLRSQPIAALAPLVAILAAGLVVFALQFDDRVDPLVPALQQPSAHDSRRDSGPRVRRLGGCVSRGGRGDRAGRRRRSDRWPAVGKRESRGRSSGRPHRVPDPHRRDRPRIGLGEPRLALVLEQRPERAGGGGHVARLRAYLHVASRRDRWQRLAPWLIVLGFAGVLFTYVGAGLFLVGEHSYGQP
jgi:hypothetical protein